MVITASMGLRVLVHLLLHVAVRKVGEALYVRIEDESDHSGRVLKANTTALLCCLMGLSRAPCDNRPLSCRLWEA